MTRREFSAVAGAGLAAFPAAAATLPMKKAVLLSMIAMEPALPTSLSLPAMPALTQWNAAMFPP